MSRAALPRRDPRAARRPDGRQARGAVRRAAREGRRSARPAGQHERRRRERRSPRVLADEAQLRVVERIDPDGDLDGARHARPHRLREDAQAPRRRARTSTPCTSSAPIRSTPRRSTTCASSSASRSRSRSAGGEQDRRRDQPRLRARGRRASELESDDGERRRGGRERHPRLRRRGARSSAGSTRSSCRR